MKKGKILVYMFLTLLLSVLMGCESMGTVNESKESEAAEMEKNFILDPDFSQGAQLYAPGKPMTFTGNIDFMKEGEDLKPRWLLTQ